MTPDGGEDVEQQELYKTKHTSVLWSSSHARLGIYSNELKTYVHRKTCTQMFTAALFTIAQTWKQPRCPSVGEWINKLLVYPGSEIYLALKKK